MHLARLEVYIHITNLIEKNVYYKWFAQGTHKLVGNFLGCKVESY
jgi:hypothetical protein